MDDIGQAEDARGIMDELGIPRGAVIFEQVEGGLLANGDSVRAKWRPVVGGDQFQIKFGRGYCSIGFVTERDDVGGMVVASHCTNAHRDIGGLDDADIYQPNKNLFQNNKVAVEAIDPHLHSISDSQCPYNYVCRYSDSAFAEAESGTSLDLGHVAQPEAVLEIDVNPVGSTFEITGEESSISIGDEVYYIGARTGWRTATVTDDNTYFEIKRPWPPSERDGVRIIHVARAVIDDGGQVPTPGDSGAPVVAPNTGDDVDLVGTVFANLGNQIDLSKIGYIYMDLGNSVTWDSCVSGC